MTFPSDPRDYSKEAQKGRMMNLAAVRALDLAKQGWLISRLAWTSRATYVQHATHGTFTAKDQSTGALDPFFVMKIGKRLFVPWQPTPEDLNAEDWVAYTAQEQTQAEPTGRITGANFATSDSDFDAD